MYARREESVCEKRRRRGGVGEGVRLLKYVSQFNLTHKDVIIAAVEWVPVCLLDQPRSTFRERGTSLQSGNLW